MTGHVRRRGATWAFVVDIGRDPETGRRKQRWASGFPRRKDAEDALTETLSQLRSATYAEPTKQTLGEFLEEWLAARRSQLRPSTHASYELILRTYVIPRIGGRRLQEITPALLNALYAELLSGGRSKTGGPLSPATVRGVAVVMHRAFRDATRWHKLIRNPAADADPPKQPGRRGHAGQTWSAEELRRFLEATQGDALYPLWLMAAMTGARRGELLGLHWRDIDLEAGRMAIHQSKTGTGIRSVALGAETVRVLRALRRRQAELRLALGRGYHDDGLVFCEEDGTPLRADGIGRRFQRAAKRAGVPVIRLHDARHTHATLSLAAGTHPKVVSERLGHASTAFTLDRYSASIPAMQADAAELAEGLVFGTGGAR